MSTEGFEGLVVETRNYGATGAFWASLGFHAVFETDHASGQWEHPAGGPYVFIIEEQDHEPQTYPILHVADAETFRPDRAPDFIQTFTPQHWGIAQALVRDPDGRQLALHAPLTERNSADVRG